MSIKVIIISANELRHKFFRKKVSSFEKVNVELCLAEKNQSRHYFKVIKSPIYSAAEKKHFKDRQKSEKIYFGKFLKNNSDLKNLLVIKRGEFNYNTKIINKIINIKPDIIISYGCSLIKNPILKKFKNKFINIHLGLSPYYKGSATNFWPFVYNEPQFAGVSFLKIDKGIDAAPIIHQIRPCFKEKDNIHDIGNKLIIKMINPLEIIIKNFKLLKSKKQKKSKIEKIFKKKDFDFASLKSLKRNFNSGMIRKYLKNKKKIDNKYPIVEQKYVRNSLS